MNRRVRHVADDAAADAAGDRRAGDADGRAGRMVGARQRRVADRVRERVVSRPRRPPGRRPLAGRRQDLHIVRIDDGRPARRARVSMTMRPLVAEERTSDPPHAAPHRRAAPTHPNAFHQAVERFMFPSLSISPLPLVPLEFLRWLGRRPTCALRTPLCGAVVLRPFPTSVHREQSTVLRSSRGGSRCRGCRWTG